ncbi:uncharacterized protein FA14DRAFT_186718 [Meira miltonrushii]|uniref:Uncharacterized protein n=1 Tax=Meira miltonrushii TaxID=1280837 RepID=A0A316VLR6_9BASI|nr:uncharacterized protein FA14DRAFT_186718 [Meira miltonrushii]PWN36505.1 hypothetical protein FA14DRAFT_186718 [Meira miltonrushii]
MTMTEKKKSSPPQRSQPMFEWIDIPLKYQSILSTVLIFFAAILLLPPPEVDINAPIFQSARDETGQHFAANRLKEAPILYGLGHGAMGALCGRLAILASFSLGISGILFSPLKLAYTAPTFHIHKLRIGYGDQKYTVLAWPTFDFGIWILGGAFLIPTLFTIQTARAKKFREHQQWAKLLTIIGYIVPLQRVFMLFLNVLAFGILPHLSSAQKSFFGCPDSLSVPAKAAAEKAGFAWTSWTAAVVMMTYSVRIKYHAHVRGVGKEVS